ncbi:MAG: hypothetical protein WCQ44_10750 [Opitutaceae bacterium]
MKTRNAKKTGAGITEAQFEEAMERYANAGRREAGGNQAAHKFRGVVAAAIVDKEDAPGAEAIGGTLIGSKDLAQTLGQQRDHFLFVVDGNDDIEGGVWTGRFRHDTIIYHIRNWPRGGQ